MSAADVQSRAASCIAAILRRLALLLSLIGIGLSAPAFGAEIAILKSSELTAYNEAISALKRDVGDGAVITEYELGGDVERGKKLARKIRASDTALVVAIGLKAALAARLEIVDIPVLYAMVLDPAKYDFHAPNFIGLSLQIPIDRQFQAMRALLPKARRIGVIHDPDKSGQLIAEARRVAKGVGLDLVDRAVLSEKQVPTVLREMLPHIDVLWLVPDSTVVSPDSVRFVLETALDGNIPVIGFSPEFVRNGALLGFSVRSADVGKQAARVAKQVLKGELTPSGVTLPPDRTRLAVNLKTARFLGIPVPPDFASRADEVY